MTYKIGTRVKKVAHHSPILGVTPIPLGAEGIVVKHEYFPKGTLAPWGVLNDDLDCVVNFSGHGKRSMHSSKLQPILPSGHVAGEEGTCEPLDKLLSEVREHDPA